jgi:hypothetical protein
VCGIGEQFIQCLPTCSLLPWIWTTHSDSVSCWPASAEGPLHSFSIATRTVPLIPLSNWPYRRITSGKLNCWDQLAAKRLTLRFSQAGRGWSACDKSFSPVDWRSPHDEEQLPRAPSADSPRECALCLRAVAHNHCDEGVGAALPASSDNDGFLFRIGGQSAQGFFPPVFQNKRYRRPQICEALFLGQALTVGARHLGTVCDEPWIVSFDDRCELVAHAPLSYPEGDARGCKTPGAKTPAAPMFPYCRKANTNSA